MTLYEFIQLNEEEQNDTLQSQGTFVDSIVLYSHPSIQYQLYAIGRFFVEFHYDLIFSKVLDKKVFSEGFLIEKYLRHNY
jgi:hypothetical protein